MKQMKSSTILGGSGDNERHAFDYYQTPKEATIALLDFLKLDISTNIIEPCCGEGAISSVLIERGFNVLSMDIRDTGYAQKVCNYLATPCNTDAIITNPPFNLAEEFIRKAINEAKIVAMLLKANYWHTKKRLNLFNEHKPSYILPLTWRPAMASDRGSSPTMDFQWTVWAGLDYTIYQPIKKPTPAA